MDQGDNTTLHEIINNYEQLVQELSNELNLVTTQHTHYKAQITYLIEENSQLSENLKEVVYTGPAFEEVTTNLTQQIEELKTEKECVSKLWQESVRSVDRLEEELRVYHSQDVVPRKELLKLKKSYNEKVSELGEAQKKLRDLEQAIGQKHSEIDLSLENQAGALKIVKNLEAEVLRLQKRIQSVFDDNSKLQKSLEDKEKGLHSLKKSNLDCMKNITEAVSIVEAAFNEKDAAIFRENETRLQNERLVEEMTQIVRECQEKISLEKLKLTEEFNQKQKVVLDELSGLQTELRKKFLEVEALVKENQLLEEEIRRMHKGHCRVDEGEINKMLVLEKNLETTFQNLLKSEKQNIQLTSDKEILKSDLDQMASIYERNLKTKEVEISTLKSRINALEEELRHSNSKADKLMERVDKVSLELDRTEREFRRQSTLQQREESCFTESKIESLRSQYEENIKELQVQVDKKNDLHLKWRKEMKNITENMEKAIYNLKKDNHILKKENKVMKQSFQKNEEKLKQYKSFLELMSKDVNKISSITTVR